MKEELKNLRKAVVVETGEAARKRQVIDATHLLQSLMLILISPLMCCLTPCHCGMQEEKGFREMLTPLELRRKKYLERKKVGTERYVVIVRSGE